jgi:predicted metal-dependent enzyme (double-stranded beta helix superfamily)
MNNQNSNTDVDVLLADILQTIDEVKMDIEETDRHATETLLHVESKVDMAVADINTLCDDIEQVETQASEDFDTLILGEIEDIANADN